MKILVFSLLFYFAVFNLCAQRNYDSLLLARQEANFDKYDFVPDAEAAIKIAKAVWVPLYGKDVLKKKPFKAYLTMDSIWVVKGTLKGKGFGGVPYAFIRKKDAKIIYMTHTK